MMFDAWMMLLIVLIAIVAALIGAMITFYIQSKKGTVQQLENNSKKEQERIAAKKDLPKEDVKNFMEFDEIEDDMIIQENGNRFVMVLKCMGINYDLMSETEMLAVEEGFGNFLNTLKYPIQLYVQARSLDLDEGIGVYKKRLETLNTEYEKYSDAVSRTKAGGRATPAQKQQMDFELKKKRTLLDYGADIVNYIERMSMNRNILQRKYYVVISYHSSELGLATNFKKEEVRDLAYSELYTRCRSIAAALAPCGVESSILKSEELAELLYIAYNKDEADTYNLKKALDNGYYRLYSTAQDVKAKKDAILQAKIDEDAVAEAELALQTAIGNIKYATAEKMGLTEEEEIEDETKRRAMQLILDNQDQFEAAVVDEALTELNNNMHQPVIDPDELIDDMSEEITASTQQLPVEEDDEDDTTAVTGSIYDNILD
ncbi:MAG: hypothetical protein J6B87_00220 [Clostridia bacterium]|nr:hypothetical protein [Clostridia bacterium]